MDTQFITDIEGNKTKAIISMEDYNYLLRASNYSKKKMIVNFMMRLKKMLMRKSIHLKK